MTLQTGKFSNLADGKVVALQLPAAQSNSLSFTGFAWTVSRNTHTLHLASVTHTKAVHMPLNTSCAGMSGQAKQGRPRDITPPPSLLDSPSHEAQRPRRDSNPAGGPMFPLDWEDTQEGQGGWSGGAVDTLYGS